MPSFRAAYPVGGVQKAAYWCFALPLLLSLFIFAGKEQVCTNWWSVFILLSRSSRMEGVNNKKWIEGELGKVDGWMEGQCPEFSKGSFLWCCTGRRWEPEAAEAGRVAWSVGIQGRKSPVRGRGRRGIRGWWLLLALQLLTLPECPSGCLCRQQLPSVTDEPHSKLTLWRKATDPGDQPTARRF